MWVWGRGISQVVETKAASTLNWKCSSPLPQSPLLSPPAPSPPITNVGIGCACKGFFFLALSMSLRFAVPTAASASMALARFSSRASGSEQTGRAALRCFDAMAQNRRERPGWPSENEASSTKPPPQPPATLASPSLPLPPHSTHPNRPTSNTSTSNKFDHLNLKPPQPLHLNLNHLDGPTTAAPQLPTNHLNRPPSARGARRPFTHAVCARLLSQCPHALPPPPVRAL